MSQRTRRHIPFTHSARDTIERSLREAIVLGDRRIGPEHLLLAVLGVARTDTAAVVMDRIGVDRSAVRSAVLASRRRSA